MQDSTIRGANASLLPALSVSFIRSLGAALLCLATLSTPAHADPEFSPQQVRDDLSFARATIAEIHPALSHSVGAEELERAAADVATRIDHSVSRDEAWRTLSRLNAVFGDAHLTVTYENTGRDVDALLGAGGGLFPYEVHVAESGAVFVTTALGGGASARARSEIVSIDGRDARDVAQDLLGRVSGDSAVLRRALLSQRWAVLYWRLYGTAPRFAVRFAGDAQPVEVAAAKTLPCWLGDGKDFDRTFGFTLRPDGTAVLRVGAFWWEDKQRFYAFTRAAFTRMKDEGARRLVIDIRTNGGGDDDMWREGILPYVANKPWRWGSNYRKRVLEAYRDEDEKTGDVVTGEIETWIEPERDNALRFEGPVYVLLGGPTYSSSILFANTMQDFGFAKLAGVGNSARASQSGSTQRRTLPNTGLVLVVPRFVLDRPSGATTPELVTPDLAIADDPFDPDAAIAEIVAQERTAEGRAP